jgi:hypothetical protein
MRRRDKKKGRISYPGRYKGGKPARRTERGLRDTRTTKILVKFAEKRLRDIAAKRQAERRAARKRRTA